MTSLTPDQRAVQAHLDIYPHAREAFQAFAQTIWRRDASQALARINARTWASFEAWARTQGIQDIATWNFIQGAAPTSPTGDAPETPAPGAPPETPAPETPAVHTPPRAPGCPTAPQTDLLSVIAQGLQASGFTGGLDGNAVREIVREEIASADIGAQRHIIEVREQERVTISEHAAVPIWFYRLMALYQARVPALLCGPAGCGKTSGVEMLARALELPFFRVSIAAGTDEGTLTGWRQPVGDNMRFSYVPSQVARGYEEGGIILIDDIDLGDPNALGILNAALDNGQWHNPLRHESPVFMRHERAYICAASNTWGYGADRKYRGANALDERTLSRFRLGRLRCDYDPKLERQLYAHARPVCQFGQDLRARCRAQGGGKDVSTRDIDSAVRLSQFVSLGESWYGFFADWTDDAAESHGVLIDHAAMTACLV